jgi:hypothetical protein
VGPAKVLAFTPSIFLLNRSATLAPKTGYEPARPDPILKNSWAFAEQTIKDKNKTQ